MSEIVSDLPQIAPGSNLEQVVNFLQRLRAYVQTREPLADTIGDPLEKVLLRRELVDLKLLGYSAAGLSAGAGAGGSAASTPGPPGPPGDPYVPDLSPPPTPANLRAVSLLRSAYIEVDAPTYTQGHGNAWTNYYIAQYGGAGPLPTAANAVKVGQSSGATTMYVHAAPIGAQLHVWAEHVSVDGVPSADWAGGINGVQVTIGKIGNADLGDLIIEAENLANGSITPRALAINIGGGNLLSNSSFELDANSDGAADGWYQYSYPSVSTFTMSRVAGRRYGAAQRVAWTGAASWAGLNTSGIPWRAGTTFVVSFYARAVSGASGAVPGLSWNVGPTETEVIAGPPMAAEWQRYAFRIRWAGPTYEPTTSLYMGVVGYAAGVVDYDDFQIEEGDVLTAYAPRPDEILPGSITGTEIADDSITTPKLVAGAVVAGKVAAGAIQAQHMLIAPKSLNLDPLFASGTAGWDTFVARYESTNPVVPPGCPARWASVFRGRDGYMNTRIQVVAGEQYRVTGWVNRNVALPDTGFILLGFAADGSHIQTVVFGVGAQTGWYRCDQWTQINAGVVEVSVAPWNSQAHGGAIESWFTDLHIEKRNDFALIVDGAILAQHLAANSIAVGTAAVQNGAIVNAMIAALAVDDAKIASMSAAKVAFGEMSGDRIAVNTLNGNRIVASSVDAATLIAWSIAATQAILADASIGNAKITDLSANKINVGLLNVDRIADGDITRTFWWEQLLSVYIAPYSSAVICETIVSEPPGSTWAGEAQAIVNVDIISGAGNHMYVYLQALSGGSWLSWNVASSAAPTPTGGFAIPNRITIPLAKVWSPGLGITRWRILCIPNSGLEVNVSGLLMATTRRK